MHINFYSTLIVVIPIDMRYTIILITVNLNLCIMFKKPDLKNTLNVQHLKYGKVKKACAQTDSICKSNDSYVCAVRFIHDEMEYKDFLNSCFLYMSNMCDTPGQEFSLIVASTCKDYFKSRRNGPINVPIIRSDKKSETGSSTTFRSKPLTVKINGTKKNLRARTPTTMSTLYDIETAFDYHTCPLSCPNTYSPVCVAVNRGHGLYFKFYTFVNHCAGDLYYCKHWEEFSPPPDEGELVKSSPLSWSYCAANKYIQYARFSEVTSSMGYYGWLAGDYKYSHIMEPHERIAGYG